MTQLDPQAQSTPTGTAGAPTGATSSETAAAPTGAAATAPEPAPRAAAPAAAPVRALLVVDVQPTFCEGGSLPVELSLIHI